MPRRIASRFEISEEMMANGAQFVIHHGTPIAPTRIVAPKVLFTKKVRTIRTANRMCEINHERRKVNDFICKASNDLETFSMNVFGVPLGV